MSGTYGHDTVGAHGTVDRNISKIVGMGTVLVAVNILLMLALSFTPLANLGGLLFSNYFVAIGFFVATVGGGFWVANIGLERGSLPLAGVGVSLTQAGYGIVGAVLLAGASTGLKVTALGISAIITGVITAVIAYYVFTTDRSFAGWQSYAFYCFIGGFAIGAVGFFTTPLLMLVAGLIFFLGFIVDLTYEIWAVRENKYASDLRNAIGIYVAVMGVFIHVLQWVLRILSMLDN